MSALKQDGKVTATYRLMIGGELVYVNFKIIYLADEERDHHIIVALSEDEARKGREVD